MILHHIVNIRHYTSFMICNLNELENDQSPYDRVFLGAPLSKIKAELRPEKYTGYCFT